MQKPKTDAEILERWRQKPSAYILLRDGHAGRLILLNAKGWPKDGIPQD